MASNIDPTIIDGDYPIAGKDQPSQGFRTNFTGIEENFSAAASEITELQGKAVLKAALSGTTLDNNMQGAEILSAKMRDLLLPVSAINWSASQLNSLDVLSGGYQSVTINQGSTYAINFNNFSRYNGYSTVLLQINNQGNNTVALPGGKNYLGLEKITNASNNSLYFYNTDSITTTRTVLSFSSADGNTFIVQDLTRDVAGLNYGIPSNYPIGRPGDKQGDVQVYQSNVYVCTQDYSTGSVSIWTVASGGGGGGGGPAGTGGQVQFSVESVTGPVFAADDNFVFSSTTEQLFVPQILANRGIEISNLAPLTVSGDITGRNITAISGGIYGNVVTGNLSVLNISNFSNLSVNNLTSNILVRGNAATFTGNVTSANLTVNNQASFNNVSVAGTLALNSLTVGTVQYANAGATVPGQVLGVTGTNQLGFFSVPGSSPQTANLTVQFADYSTGIGRFNGNTNFTYNFEQGANLLTTPNLSVTGLATIATAGITTGTVTSLAATSANIVTLRASSANINSQYSLPTVRTTGNGYVLVGFTDGSTDWQATSSLYGNANVAAFLAAFGSNTVNTTGNVTAGYFIGNGALLTGLSSIYSNANVAAYLPTYTGFIGEVNSAGNANINGDLKVSVTANIFANGLIRTTGPVQSGTMVTTNITVGEIIGNANLLTISTPIETSYGIDAVGNVITSAYFLGDGGLLSNLPGATPGGANTQIQFNDNGVFGGESSFIFDKGNAALTITGNITTNGSLTAGGSLIGDNFVVSLGTANLLTIGALDPQFQTTIGNLLVGDAGNSTGLLQVEGNTVLVDVTIGGAAIIGSDTAYQSESDLFVAGNLKVFGRSNVGSVSNVTILGGSAGQALVTDGTGNLTWSTVAGVANVISITSNTTISTDGVYIINSPNANVTVTLPAGNANIIGKTYNFKDIGGNAFLHPITIATQGLDLIDGNATAQVGAPYNNLVIMYLTTNIWGIM
jgi:hypothetical protein